MEKKTDKIIEDLKKISLTNEEKSRMFSEIKVFISENPLVENVAESVIKSKYIRHITPERESPLMLLKLSIFKSKFMPVAIILALILSGGVSFAAENTLPGDLLYPVKVNVNEEVRTWASFGTEAKAEIASRFAERRLEEAETLAISGDLKAETRERLEANFSKQTDRVEARIEKLESSGNVETAAKMSSILESSLKVHHRILAGFDENVSTTSEIKQEVKNLKSTVRVKANNAESLREKLELRLTSEGDEAGLEFRAEGRITALENKLAEVLKFVESKKDDMDAEIYADISLSIKDAEASLLSAKDLLAEADFEGSIEISLDAFRHLQEIKTVAIFNSNAGVSESERGIRVRALIGSGVGLMATSSDESGDDDEEDEDIEGEEEDGRGNSERGENRGNVELELDLSI